MAKTEVSGKQLKDGSVELVDLAAEVTAVLNAKADTSSLATVATSGSYTDLADKPSIPSVDGLASETYVDTAVAAVQADVDAEETRALAAEVVLQGNIDDEETRALAAEATEASERTADVDAEETRALAAEAVLQGNIDAEETRALAAEAVLQGNIDAEETRALAAEATEVGDRQAADIILQGNIDTIETDYIAGDAATLASANSYTDSGVAALVNSAPAVLNTLNELALALGSDPDFATTVSGNIGAIDTRVTAAEGNITTLQTSVATKAATSSLAAVATSGSYVDLTNKPTIPTDLDSLTDVTITTPAADQIIKYNGTAWVNSAAAAAGAATLDELTDVVIATPLKGHLVVHNGTNFVNSNTIETSGAAVKALIVKGAASQTANLLEIQNSAGTIAAYISASGLKLAGLTHINDYKISKAGTMSTAYGDGALSVEAGPFADNGNGLTGNNTAIGKNSMASLTIGMWNTAVGSGSMQSMVGYADFHGVHNTAVGYNAMSALSANRYNTAIGSSTVCTNNNATAIGAFATSNGDGIALGRSCTADAGAVSIGFGVTAPSSCFRLAFGGSNSYSTLVRIAGDANGLIGINEITPGAQLQVTSGAAARKGLIVKGAASQTANLIEVQNSSSQILNKVGSDGSLSLYDSAGANGYTLSNVAGDAKVLVVGGKKLSVASTGAFNYASSLSFSDEGGTNAFAKGKWMLRTTQTSGLNIVPNYSDANFFGGVGILVPNNRYIGARFHIFNITDAGNRGDSDPMDNYSGQSKTSLLIHGYSNHTANHIEIQDQSNNKTFAINGQGQIAATSATHKPLVVIGFASQTANLLEIQNSAGTALVSVSSGGTLHAARYTETAANAFTTTLTPSTGTLTVDTSTGNAVLGTLAAAVTTWAFTNVPTENSKVTSVTVVLVGNATYTYGDACSVNGSAVTNGIMWSGGTAPTATAGTDLITFVIVKDSAGTIKVLGSATTNFS